MKIIHCAQGSPEWHKARAGVITASMFKHVRATARLKSGPNKGDYSSEARAYAFRLAIERISGEALQDDQFETYAMRRGHELEPEARACHEALGIMVQPAGFVVTDCGRFGSSTDGTIAEPPNGAAEYKCLVSPIELRSILLENDLGSFDDQMLGGIFVCEADYFHFGLYCPALRCIGQHFTLKLVERDDAAVASLRTDLLEFDALVEDYKVRLLNGARRNTEAIQLLVGGGVPVDRALQAA